MKKHQDKKRRFAAILAIVLAALMILPLLATVITSVGAVTQSEIDGLKDDAKDISSKKNELQQQLSEIQNDKSKALQQKELLDDQVSALEREIANVDAQITYYDSAIAGKETEIAAAEEKEQEQYDLLCERVRIMEEDGDVSYWAILMQSASFSDLLDRLDLVNEIIDYDNAIMNALTETRKQIQEDKAALEESRSSQEQIKSQKEIARQQLDAKVVEAQSLVAEMEEKSDEYSAALAAAKKEEDAILAQIAKKQKELDAQNSTPKGDGTYIWPLPAGYYTLTSKFGWRIHPVYGTRRYHNGTDIAAPNGTPIYAAASGTVTISKKASSYGNYVVIYHGNGTSTLYAHMNSRAVSEGQSVKQGQVIGYVGSTGTSTGNHLHLEFQVNGTRKDAESYYPQLNSVFVRRY